MPATVVVAVEDAVIDQMKDHNARMRPLRNVCDGWGREESDGNGRPKRTRGGVVIEGEAHRTATAMDLQARDLSRPRSLLTGGISLGAGGKRGRILLHMELIIMPAACGRRARFRQARKEGKAGD